MTANAIYLVIILVALISSLISRKDISFSKILKYLAIWSLIGFVAIALYSYRYEFSDFKSRIAGEINPSAAQVTNSGEIIIRASEDGHFYINTKINGSAVRFMIDTGASDITLTKIDAEKAGINLKTLQFNKAYQTANGVSYGAFCILKKFEIDEAVFYDVKASVNSAEMSTSLLGMSFLRQFKKYEFYQDKLALSI